MMTAKITALMSRRPMVWIVLTSLVLGVSGSWILPLMDRDEPRFAEASREMLQRRDWIIPWFNGSHRFDKPPLIYWCQMLAYLALGDSEFSARLPSALFTAATALLIYLWGKKVLGQKAGTFAALGFSTSLMVLVYGRIAIADPAMVFFYTAACWAGWEMAVAGRRFSWRQWLTLVFALALGFLAKGPVAWLPMAGLAWLNARRPAQFRFGWPLWSATLLAASALVAIWGVPALLETKGEFFTVGVGHHVIERSFNVFDGHGIHGWLGAVISLPFYVPVILLGFFPWSGLLVKRLRGLGGEEPEEAFSSYLLAQIIPVVAVFSLVQTKLPHYIFPAIPLLALWVCAGKGILAGHAERRLAARFAGSAAVCLLVTLFGFPIAKGFFISKELFDRTAQTIRPDFRIVSVGNVEPSMVWEFRRVCTNYIEPAGEAAWTNILADAHPAMLILPCDKLPAITNQRLANATFIRQAGRNLMSTGKNDLAVVILP